MAIFEGTPHIPFEPSPAERARYERHIMYLLRETENGCWIHREYPEKIITNKQSPLRIHGRRPLIKHLLYMLHYNIWLWPEEKLRRVCSHQDCVRPEHMQRFPSL